MEYQYKEVLYQQLENLRITTNKPDESIRRLYMPALKNFIDNYLSTGDLYDKPIKSLSTYDLDKYFVSLAQNKSEATVKNQFRAIKSIFHLMYKENLTDDLFFNIEMRKYAKIAKENEVDKDNSILSNDKRRKLYQFISNENENIRERLLLSLIIKLGLSRGELMMLKRSDIDLEFGFIYTRKKNEDIKGVQKVLTNSVSKLIQEFVETYEPKLNEYIFGGNGKDSWGYKNEVDKITMKILNEKIAPKRLRDMFRFRILKEYGSKMYLIAKHLDETPNITEEFIKKHYIFETEDMMDEIRIVLEEFDSKDL